MYNFQIKAYEASLLNKFVKIIESTLTNLLKDDVSISIVRTPTRIKRFTLLKSPHVNKTAREQFETRMYSCLIKINTSLISIQEVERAVQSTVPPGIAIKFVNKTTL